MDYSNSEEIPADLEEIAARLREQRAEATPFDLDRIKLRAMKQAETTPPNLYTRKKGQFMKSRLALVLVLATGMLMGTTGATLAVTGSSGSGSAAENQYTPPKQDDDNGATLGASDSGGLSDPDLQVAATSDSGSLPFSGFAAVPLLVLGIGFLLLGLVMRRGRASTS